MNNKPLLTSLICFVPLLLVPPISPDIWGPAIGTYYLLPLGPFIVFGSMAFIYFLVCSLFNYTMVFYLSIMSELKPELEIEPTDTEYEPTDTEWADSAAKCAEYLGLIFVSSVPMYVYYALIAWHIGLDVASPSEAFEVLVSAFDGDNSDYDQLF